MPIPEQPGAYADAEVIQSDHSFGSKGPKTHSLRLESPNIEGLPNVIARAQANLAAKSKMRVIGIRVLNEETGLYEPILPAIITIKDSVVAKAGQNKQ